MFRTGIGWQRIFGVSALLIITASSVNAECPVPLDRRDYVAEIVQKLTFDLAFVGNNIHGRDRGFALTLFGIDNGFAGQLLLVNECTNFQSFDPDVENVTGPRMTRRLQITCEAAGVDVVKIEAASGPLARKKRHFPQAQLRSHSLCRLGHL
jgi:hypothetical protein